MIRRKAARRIKAAVAVSLKRVVMEAVAMAVMDHHQIPPVLVMIVQVVCLMKVAVKMITRRRNIAMLKMLNLQVNMLPQKISIMIERDHHH